MKKNWKQLLKKTEKQILADHFVCALPVEAVSKLISKNPYFYKKQASLKNIELLASLAEQIMLSIQFYFDCDIKLPYEKCPIYLIDTP